jgi:hypothetical protein
MSSLSFKRNSESITVVVFVVAGLAEKKLRRKAFDGMILKKRNLALLDFVRSKGSGK